MKIFRVKWEEIRVHYIEVEADNELDAIDRSREFSYEETVSDTSWYDGYGSTRVNEERE